MHRPTLALFPLVRSVAAAVSSLPFSTIAAKAEEVASPGLRAVVSGSTGGVGRRVVHHLARDERVASVTALTRRSRDDTTTLFDLSPAEAAKVKFAVVDHDALAAGTGSSSIDTFAGHDIGMSCLGLYTSDAKDEAHFRHVEITTNVATATAMVAGGVDRFAYLSGRGAKKDGWMMFARVKADAEEALRQVPGMARSTAVRPGAIIGRQGASSGYDWLNDLIGPVLSRLGMAVHIDDIAKSMLQVTMQPTSDTTIQEVLENEDIKAAARVYEAGLAGASSGGGGGSGHDEAEK